jgi:hypothetical protein
MSEAWARKSCNTSSLLVAAVLLLVLSSAEALSTSPDEGADGVFDNTGEDVAGMHHIQCSAPPCFA